MALFRKKNSASASTYSPEIDATFVGLMTLTASIVHCLTKPDVSEAELTKTYEDAVNAESGWSGLAEQGYFMTASRPYADAMAKVVLGLANHDVSHVQEGVLEMGTIASEGEGGKSSPSGDPLPPPLSESGVETRVPQPRSEWPEVQFDRDRNVWVCVRHSDPRCSECPGAFDLLAARNRHRMGA